MTDILTLLALLTDLHAEQAALLAAQAVALPAEVRKQLAALSKKFAPDLEAVATEIELVERQVKEAVLAHQQSVKGATWQAIYVAGKASWDDRALHGYAVEHPALLAFRSHGKPSVTLRRVQEPAGG